MSLFTINEQEEALIITGLRCFHRDLQSRAYQIRKPLEWMTPGSEGFRETTKMVEGLEDQMQMVEALLAKIKSES